MILLDPFNHFHPFSHTRRQFHEPARSIREGIRFSAILTTIRTIGWLPYIILLAGFAIASVIYAAITGILSSIPFIGWVLVIIVNPFFMIFTARYFTLVYDEGEPQPVTPGLLRPTVQE